MSAYLLALHAPLLVLCAIAATTDLRQRRIPNWLTLSLLLSGLIQAAWLGQPASLYQSLIGVGIALLAGIIMLGLNAFGGGDVKLLLGIGAWLGWQAALVVLGGATVVAMAMAIGQALWFGKAQVLARNTAVLALEWANCGPAPVDDSVHEAQGDQRVLPYGFAVFIAVLIWTIYRTTLA